MTTAREVVQAYVDAHFNSDTDYCDCDDPIGGLLAALRDHFRGEKHIKQVWWRIPDEQNDDITEERIRTVIEAMFREGT